MSEFATIFTEAIVNLLLESEEIIVLNAGISLMLQIAKREMIGNICSVVKFIKTKIIAIIETAKIEIKNIRLQT